MAEVEPELPQALTDEQEKLRASFRRPKPEFTLKFLADQAIFDPASFGADQAIKFLETPSIVDTLVPPIELFGSKVGIQNIPRDIMKGAEEGLKLLWAPVVAITAAFGKFIENAGYPIPAKKTSEELQDMLMLSPLLSPVKGPGMNRNLAAWHKHYQKTVEGAARKATNHIKNPEMREVERIKLEGQLYDAQAAANDQVFLRTNPEILANDGKFTMEILNERSRGAVIETAVRVLQESGIDTTVLSPTKLYKMFSNMLHAGKLDGNSIATMAELAGMDEAGFKFLFDVTYSEAGKALNQMSQASKRIRKEALQGVESAQEYIKAAKRMQDNQFAYELGTGWKRWTNVFRGALVTMTQTAIRNIGTATVKVGMNSLARSVDRELGRVMKKAGLISKDATLVDEPIKPLAELHRILFRQAKTKGEVDRIMSAFPQMKSELFTNYSSDVITQSGGLRIFKGKIKLPKILGKNAFGERRSINLPGILVPDIATVKYVEIAEALVHHMNLLNRTQEFIVRRAVFMGSIDRQLAGKGLKTKDVFKEGKGLTDSMIQRATTEALDATFALSPRSGEQARRFDKIAAPIIRVIHETPGLGVLEPFPRFLYNSIEHNLSYNMTGFLRALGKVEKEAMSKGDFSMIGKATVGTALMALGWRAAYGEIPGFTPGDKPLEFKDEEGRTGSLLGWSPVVTPLFIGQVLKRIADGTFKTLTYEDFRDAFVGGRSQTKEAIGIIKQAAGWIQGMAMDKEKFADRMETFVGQVVSGSLNWVRQWQDFNQELGETLRTTRGGGVKAQLQKATGVDKEELPEATSPLTAPPIKHPTVNILGHEISAGLAKQLSGIKIEPKRTLAQETYAKLGLRRTDIAPKTGNKKLDILVERRQGYYMDLVGPPIFGSNVFKQMSVEMKRLIAHKVGLAAKRQALRDAMLAAPVSSTVAKEFKKLSKLEMDAINSILEGRGFEDIHTMMNNLSRAVRKKEMKPGGFK